MSPNQHCQDWVSSPIGSRHIPWEGSRSTPLPKYGGGAVRWLKLTAGTLGNCPINVAADSSLVGPDQFPWTALHTLLLGSRSSSTLPLPALCITVTPPSLLFFSGFIHHWHFILTQYSSSGSRHFQEVKGGLEGN